VRKKNILINIFLALFILFFMPNCHNAPPVLHEEPSNLSAINRENNPPDNTALNDLDRAVSRARTARQQALDINVPSHYPVDWATITTHFFRTEQQIMTSTLRETQEATARYYAMAEAFEAINLRTFVMYAASQEQAAGYTDEISNAFEIMASFSLPENNELAEADIDMDIFPQEDAAVIDVATLLPQTGIPAIPNAGEQLSVETPAVHPHQTATPVAIAQRATPAVAAQSPIETPASSPQSATPAAVTQSPPETPAPQVQSGAAVVVEKAVSEIPLSHEEPPVVEETAVSNSALLNTEPEQVKPNNTIFFRLLIITFSCIAAVCCVLFVSKKKTTRKRARSG